ncbi:MAG: HAMP domain-containing histidine kinase [Ruminococcaceae bacterium]|nr:HAMP domain-containing histidine kinase [Oscillospiraceae bacterium]
MFKSTFAKYLTAFVIILLISFIILSSIITTTVRKYVTDTKEGSVVNAASILAEELELVSGDDFRGYIYNEYKQDMPGILKTVGIISEYEEIKVMLTDEKGEVLLTTLFTKSEDGHEKPLIWAETDKNLGKFDFKAFEPKTNTHGEYLLYVGSIESLGNGKYQVCSKQIRHGEKVLGYAVSLISLEKEDAMVSAARKTIINSSFWVMLAAVVAVYLITERIVNPLKSISKATKKFAKGDFSARVAICGHDEIAELGESFNQMAESLDNLEKMRNSFLANVSHDLRTPMTTIAGFIDGITSGAIPPEKHNYYLGIISDEVHRLSRLVSDLLDVSRLESGERKFNFTNFDIAEMARIILISFEQKISDKRLDVIFESDEDSMFVTADKDAIHQVMYNLMHNAIKFSEHGGKLAIYISRGENKRIRISVYNEGQGISKKELPLIFDKFYKTDKSRGLDKSGVGLGLYICQTIVKSHGEEIHAESPNESGAEFWFMLKEGTPQSKDRSRDV